MPLSKYYKHGLIASLLFSLISVSGCMEDLSPDSKDLRDNKEQVAKEFTVDSTRNKAVSLSDSMKDKDAVVLYFTMWCSLCNYHMEYIDSHFVPRYSNVKFLMVDYINGSISLAKNSQQENSYVGSTVLADIDNILQDAFSGTMATVVVINKQNKILLNEDFKDGQRLAEILDSL